MQRGLRSMVSWCMPAILAEAGGIRVQGQLGLHVKFKTSLGYMVRMYLSINKERNSRKEKGKSNKDALKVRLTQQ